MPSKDAMLRFGSGRRCLSWRPPPSSTPSPCTASDDSRSEGSDSEQEVPSPSAMAERRRGPVRPQRADTRPIRARNADNPIGRAAPRRGDRAVGERAVRLKSKTPTRHGEKRVPAPPKYPPPQRLKQRQRGGAAASSWQQPASAMVERSRPVRPYRERPDVGMLGIVNGCYNGCTEDEAGVDLARCAGYVILLQRVPGVMLDTLRHGPRDSGDDCRENRKWMWVAGSHDPQDNRLVIAARVEAVAKMKRLACKEAPRRGRSDRDPPAFMIVDLERD